MNKLLPVKETNSLFFKIKNWFKMLLKNKPKNESLESPVEIQPVIEDASDNFLSNLKKETMSNALLLQQEIEAMARDITELTEEEYNEIVELYKFQIKETREKISRLINSKKKGSIS